MTRILGSLALLSLALISACETSQSRIKKNKEKFDSYPPEAQEAIKAGKVQVGFTPEMVLMTLGKPSRKYTRTTGQETLEIWAYTQGQPGLGLSLGALTGSSSLLYGGGVSVGGGGRQDEKIRVVFKEGKVEAVERREK